jgi:hypothetical protein
MSGVIRRIDDLPGTVLQCSPDLMELDDPNDVSVRPFHMLRQERVRTQAGFGDLHFGLLVVFDFDEAYRTSHRPADYTLGAQKLTSACGYTTITSNLLLCLHFTD